jgi:hypothetical protein
MYTDREPEIQNGNSRFRCKEEQTMRMRLLVCGSILALTLVSVAFAVDINGKWKGSFEGGQGGGVEQSFTFKVDGEKVSGTMSDPMMGEAKITEGTLKGDDISFTVVGKGEMGEMTIKFKGKVKSADEMNLTLSFSGGPGGDQGGPGGPDGGMQITVKRVK